jgi:hypothetical protein
MTCDFKVTFITREALVEISALLQTYRGCGYGKQ